MCVGRLASFWYPRPCPTWFSLSKAIDLRRFPTIDIVRRALVLPQSYVLDFVESPWKALPSLRSGLGVRWGKRWREQEERRE